MRGRLLVIAAGGATLLALALLPSASAAPHEFVLTGGAPLRLAGAIDAQADAARIVLEATPLLFALDHDGATLRTIVVTSEYALAPTGQLVLVHRTAAESLLELGAGSVQVLRVGPDGYVLVDADSARLESAAPAPDPRHAWGDANAQVTTLLHPRLFAPPVAASLTGLLEDPTAGPGTDRVEAGWYAAHADEGTITGAATRLGAFDATIRAGHAQHAAGLLVERAPGGAWVLDPLTGEGSWTGPGEHVEETLTLLVLEAPDAVVVADAGTTSFYARDLRLDIDGYAVFAWARGAIESGAGERRVDGQQVTLGGRFHLAALGPDLDAAAIAWIGSGDLTLVQVGPVPAASSAPEAAVVAGTAGAAALGLAALVYYWPLAKYGAAGLLAPLYARVPRDHVLDHHGREVVYERIRAEPGISTHRLAQSVEFGWSTLAYHLRVLERNQLVVSVRDGRYKRFFDRENGHYANGRKYAIVVLRNETTHRVARAILEQPGVTQKELSELFGLSPSSVHWHVERLQEAGLAEKARDGHNVRYRPGRSWGDVRPEDVGLQASYVAAFGARPAAAMPAPGAAADASVAQHNA